MRAIPAVGTPVLCRYLVIAAARPVGWVRSRASLTGHSGLALCSAAAVDFDRRFRRDGREPELFWAGWVRVPSWRSWMRASQHSNAAGRGR